MLVTRRSSFNTLLLVSKVLPRPSPPLATSSIHNCAYNLMEELIKYFASLFFVCMLGIADCENNHTVSRII
jgi:hypothetical protein